MLEAVILAAGKSQRFGGIKQLASINGRNMLQHCISQYFSADTLLPDIAKLSVVLGANESLITPNVVADVTLFVAPNWQSGMGASLADFVKQLPLSCSHLLVGLADQVALTQQDFTHLLHHANQHPDAIVCAQYGDIQGVPAIFPRRYFAELSCLAGDKGARMLIKKHLNSVSVVEMPNAAYDVDTPQDLHKVLAQFV